jgi:hypothetical protein
VAAVYAVDGYLVYRSTVGSRGHGRNDRIDVGHAGDQRGRCYADLLDGAAEIPVDRAAEQVDRRPASAARAPSPGRCCWPPSPGTFDT